MGVSEASNVIIISTVDGGTPAVFASGLPPGRAARADRVGIVGRPTPLGTVRFPGRWTSSGIGSDGGRRGPWFGSP